VRVSGQYAPEFQGVAEELAANVAAGNELGACLYVNVDGDEVLDVWGGSRHDNHTDPWTEDTVVALFSLTKTVTSLAALMLVDRGMLDLDRPVADYWPEFGAGNKSSVLVRHVLGHTAGLPAWDLPFGFEDAFDHSTAAARLAGQEPWWPPGTRGAYHGSTFGPMLTELVRRTSGTELNSFVADQIAGPLNAEFFLGMNGTEPNRVATIYLEEVNPAAGGNSLAEDPAAIETARRIASGSFGGTVVDPFQLFNSMQWRSAALAGSSGHGNARGVGRIMSVLARAGTTGTTGLIAPATADRVFEEQWSGVDAYLRRPVRWGIGYALSHEDDNSDGPLPYMRPGRRTCYWYGQGGSVVIVDRERRLTFAYATNRGLSNDLSPAGQYYRSVYKSLEPPYMRGGR
jgi:CubicO group peptidase (beta-lactamase class C family)